MRTLNREQLTAELPEIINVIRRGHKPDLAEIMKELFINNKPVKGLTHTRGFFVIIPLSKLTLYVYYEVAHTLRVETDLFSAVALSVESVTLYDNYIEYEADRVKKLSAGKDQQGLNLN
jgi:hypothetical protein